MSTAATSDARRVARILVVRLLGIALLAVGFLAGTPLWAQPGDLEVELFQGAQRKVFALGEGENQRLCEGGFGFTALKAGKKVGVLIQRFHSVDRVYPDYRIFTGTHNALPRDFTTVSGEMVLFRLGNPVGVWPMGHPEGVTFSKHRSTTIVGGVNPETPAIFCRLNKPTDPWVIGRIQQLPLSWVTVYGQATYVKLFDAAGRELLQLTSKGQDMADYDLSDHPALKNLARYEVGVRRIEIVPGPGPVAGPSTPDNRRYWVARPGHYFLNAGGKAWDEFQNHRKVFSFTETRRSPDFVEFFDTSRNLWVRLHADRAVLLRKDDPSSQWQPLGPGKWSQEEPPKLPLANVPGPPGQGPPPATLLPGTPSLAGVWTSNFGITYQIQQTGANFTWTVPALKETGQGKFLSKDEVSAQWTGSGGSGMAKGRITQADAAGKPTRIEWNHGIVFTRK